MESSCLPSAGINCPNSLEEEMISDHGRKHQAAKEVLPPMSKPPKLQYMRKAEHHTYRLWYRGANGGLLLLEQAQKAAAIAADQSSGAEEHSEALGGNKETCPRMCRWPYPRQHLMALLTLVTI